MVNAKDPRRMPMKKIISVFGLCLTINFCAATAFANRSMGGSSVIKTISVTPVIYAATDYVDSGTVGNLMEFANMVTASGRGGIIQTAIGIDDAGQEPELELWLFDRAITPSVDTNQFSITEGDMENFIGVIKLAAGNWKDGGTPSGATRAGLGLAFQSNGTSIFGVLKVVGTYNAAAVDDITIKITTLSG